MKKHEYLTEEDYYETRKVNKGRVYKICESCGKPINVGTPHDVHTFYPEFTAYATHNELSSNNGDKCEEGQKSCSDEFLESLN